jgi:hypothetical protein
MGPPGPCHQALARLTLENEPSGSAAFSRINSSNRKRNHDHFI